MWHLRNYLVRRRLSGMSIFTDDANLLSDDCILEVEAPVYLNGARFSGFHAGLGGTMRVGGYSYLRGGITVTSLTSMGRFCSVARNVRIGEINHPVDWVSSHPFAYVAKYTGRPEKMQPTKELLREPPVIGHDVWLGLDAIVMSGVTIGNGAIVAAGAVVTRDVEPYSIVGGVPAKEIRKRFPDEIIQELERVAWWNYDPKELVDLDCKDVPTFLRQFEEAKLKPMTYPVYQVSRQGLVVRRVDSGS